MMLASPIIVTVAGEAIELRPSLSHAFAVFRRHTLQGLLKGITEGSLTIASELIAPHASGAMPRRLFETELLRTGLDNLTVPLLQYVTALAGIDPDAKPEEDTGKPKADAKPVDFEESLTALFRLGTGWLSWTPAVTLAASPAEISEAYRGRLEMLNALFGTSEKAKKPKDDRPLEQKFRSLFAAHGTVKEGA